MAERERNTRELQSLLRGEISAVETYNQALEKVGDEPGAQELRRIASDHREAVNLLRNQITLEGEVPDSDSGAWGAFARSVEGTAKLFGDKSALKALKEGEEHGLKDYRDALEDGDTPPELGRVIRDELLPRQQEHIRTLDRLIDRQ